MIEAEGGQDLASEPALNDAIARITEAVVDVGVVVQVAEERKTCRRPIFEQYGQYATRFAYGLLKREN